LSMFKPVGWRLRKIRVSLRLRGDDEFPSGNEAVDAKLPRKTSKLQVTKTVLETDTGGQVENTKALERTRVKELGKMAP
jgi:hypothetical protein